MDILIALFVAAMIFCIIMMYKNEITYKMRFKIIHAIGDYQRNLIGNDFEIELSMYDRIEEYNETLWRLEDWGYTNILPSEDFEKIKPFIQ